MKKEQRLRYEMFVRVRNFGTVNRDVFPEWAPAGQKFAQLAVVVTTIEEQLVRRARARAEARRVKVATRQAAWNYMKAIASTGRQAADEEPGPPHPFRLPERRAATVVFTTARLFLEEAERRREKFEELGMPPEFLTDFGAAVDALAAAKGLQQDSRGVRTKAQAAIETSLARGVKLVGQLDVTVANALRTDPVRLGHWRGARRVDRRSSTGTTKPMLVVTNTQTPSAVTPPDATSPVDPPEEVLKMAS